jgi:hypothetical protein
LRVGAGSATERDSQGAAGCRFMRGEKGPDATGVRGGDSMRGARRVGQMQGRRRVVRTYAYFLYAEVSARAPTPQMARYARPAPRRSH